MLRLLWLRLLATFWPKRSERRLDEEIGEHLDALTAWQSKRGLRPEQARLAARREFGPVELAKEQYRDQVRFRSLENAGRDLRFALRQCRKNPGFTVAAVLSLALGIGANTALFSFVNAVMLKQLPVPGASRLVLLKNAGKPTVLSYDQLNFLNREASEVDGVSGSYPLDVSFMVGEHPQWVSAELVTGEYFHTLQIKPERGRLLTQGELDHAEGDPECVISYRFWKSQFHGAEDAIGRTILLNTRPYKIIGVSERGFTGADLQRPADLQIPATRLVDYMPAFVGKSDYDWKSRLSFFSVLARMKPGTTRAGAAGRMTSLNRDYLKAAKIENRAANFELADGSAGLQSSNFGRPATILLAVSLVVLLIACANLATLLLSRTWARSSEFALRLAIGGSRKRIMAQVLVESMLLAVMGTAASVGVAYAVKQVLLVFLNRTTPQIHQLHIALDGTVLGFAAAISAICVLLFGAAPAFQAARTARLGQSAGNTHAGVTLRKAFVVAQIALSFMVVLSAGLLTGTLRNLTAVNLGFRPDEIAAIDIRPAAGGYSGGGADRFYARVVDRVRTLPGVKAAATAFGINFAGGGFKMKFDALRPSGTTYEVNICGVNPGYFDTFRARILAGRDFDASDAGRQQQVYIINEHLARTYFGGENPIGRYLLHDGRKFPVIGVVSDIRDRGPRETAVDTIYQDAGQLLASSLTVFVRCGGGCAPLLPTLRTAIQNLEPSTPVLSVRTLQTEITGAFSSQEVLGFLSTLFAALAVLLVAAGIYGVLSYTLTRRTREIGVRIALGASARDISGLFIYEAAAMVAVGTLLGVPAALTGVTFLQSQLFGIQPHDPRALAVCFVCIAVTIVLASIAPIRRALRIAPQVALRIE